MKATDLVLRFVLCKGAGVEGKSILRRYHILLTLFVQIVFLPINLGVKINPSFQTLFIYYKPFLGVDFAHFSKKT